MKLFRKSLVEDKRCSFLQVFWECPVLRKLGGWLGQRILESPLFSLLGAHFCHSEGIRPSWHSVEGAPGVRGQRPSVKGPTIPVRMEQELGLHYRQ